MTTKSTALFLTLGVALLASCKKDDQPVTPASDMMTVSATIDNKAAVPATPSTATGTLTGDYNMTTKVLNYTVTYQGMTPTVGHFHYGAPGKSGDHIFVLDDVSKSPIKGTVTLKPETADSLMAGKVYVNLHSSTYAAGEIRGNVTVK